jgi:hypothetical protein
VTVMVKRTKVTYTDATGKTAFIKPNNRKEISEFRMWFESQFGKRPTVQQTYEIKEEINSISRDLFNLRTLLEQVERYEIREQAALYAWSVKEMVAEERKKEPYPVCPDCGNNEDVIKNGTVKRKGVTVQNWHCKNCKKTW